MILPWEHSVDGSLSPLDDIRGQTLPDFAIGVAFFLITVAFVSIFVPQMILPFEDQEEPVVVERATSGLGNDVLVEEGNPSKLNETATRTFFDDTEEEALDRLGLPSWYSMNVTIRDAPSDRPNSNILCAVDPNGDEWIGKCNASADQFSLGQPTPMDARSVATGRKALYSSNSTVVLEVRVW